MTDRLQAEFTQFGAVKEKTYGKVSETDGENKWTAIEPETIQAWGNEYNFESRNPFNVDRLMRRKVLTGFSARASMEGDMTDWHMDWLMPMALLADWQGDLPEYTVATVTATGFTLSTQDYASLVEVGTLIEVLANSDGLTPGRYRVKKGTGNAITEMIPITASETSGRERMISEGTAVAGQTPKSSSVTAKIRVIGIALVGATAKAITLTKGKVSQAGSGKMNYSTNGSGLTEDGKGIFITVKDTVASDKVAAAKKHIGFARLSGRGEGFLDYQRSDGAGSQSADVTLTANASGTAYIFISKWIKNVPADNAKWNQASWRLAAKYTGLKSGGSADPVFEEIRGCHLNGLSLRFPQQSRIRMNADFVGQVKETLAQGTTPSNWAALADAPATEAIATSVDIGRATLFEINAEGGDVGSIATLIQTLDMSFTNNIEPDFVIDSPQSIGPQIGKFGLSASVTSMVAARRMFEVVESTVPGSLQVSCGSYEGWWMFDIPQMTLTGDRKNLERNRSIKMDFQVEYIPDEDLETALIVSRFPWLPIERKAVKS